MVLASSISSKGKGVRSGTQDNAELVGEGLCYYLLMTPIFFSRLGYWTFIKLMVPSGWDDLLLFLFQTSLSFMLADLTTVPAGPLHLDVS